MLDRLEKLRSHQGKDFLFMNPLYPESEKKRDMEKMNEELVHLKTIHGDLVRRVKKLKQLIPDITDQTVLCAIYLIYGKVLQTWESIFLLASQGKHFDTMELIRSIGENLDLIHTFHLEEKGKYLKKWFSGEIVEHGVSRKIGGEFLKKRKIKIVEENDLSPQQIARDIYRAFSKYTHGSYSAVLDSVDVFNEDFDWNGYAGAHYMIRHKGALENAMVATLVALKMTYLSMEDDPSFNEIDKILTDFAGPMDEESLKELFSKNSK